LPTYEYHCDQCEKNFDTVQSFHDEPLSACPTCGGPVKKVFGNVGIVFKGSGFYKTDSRGGGPSSSPDTDKATSTPEPAASSTDPKGDAKSPGSPQPDSGSNGSQSTPKKASSAREKTAAGTDKASTH
jgi:putative FmdB family regulatory protein